MKAKVILATALTALSSAVLAAGPSTTFNQTQSVAAGVSGSAVVGTGTYTSNSNSVAGANAGSTVTPTGSAGTATAYHDSTSTASGSGLNGGAFAAGGGIGAAGSFAGNSNTNVNANALSGGVTATIVLGANHYTATGANDAGIANGVLLRVRAWAGRARSRVRITTTRRPCGVPVRPARRPRRAAARAVRPVPQAVLSQVWGASFPATLVSFPALLSP